MANPTSDEVKYDVTDVEPGRSGGGDGDWGGNGHQPKPGIVNAVLVRSTARTENKKGEKLNKPDIEWVFEVKATPGRAESDLEDGAWLAIYTQATLNDDSWSEAQVLEALGIATEDPKTRKGKFKRSAQVGKPVRLKIIADTSGYSEEYRAKIGRVMKPAGSDGSAAASPPSGGSGNGDEDEPPF